MSFFKTIAQGVVGAFLEKPEYQVVSVDKKLPEERHYAKSVWVSTETKSISQEKAIEASFYKLFDYIQGNNNAGKKLDMTAPVLTKIEPGDGPNCEATFTVSFFVGKEHWVNVPEPTNPDLKINSWEEMDVYAIGFGGFANDEKFIGHAKQLSEQCEGKDDFIKEYYFTAGYDSPFKLFNRLNEVWFVKKSASNAAEN